MSSFESWLTGAFPEARVIGRTGTGVRAFEWVVGNRYTTGSMDGWINEDRTAIYLSGAPELMAATAMAVRDLFPDESPVSYTEDWQGIALDLRKVRDPQSLVQAVVAGDLALEWRDGDGQDSNRVVGET